MKQNTELLDSGSWYFVNIREGEDMKKFVIDQKEYNSFFDGLDNDGKFIKIGNVYHFWSKIDSFGPIQFDDGVLSQLKTLSPEIQDFIKKRIRLGHEITTIDKLRSEVSFYNSKETPIS